MTRLSPSSSYRVAATLAVGAGLFLVLVSQGVGIIGADGDPANRLYLGVLAGGLVGALAARFRAGGLALTMAAVAVAMVGIGAVAMAGGWGQPYSGPLEVGGLTVGFAALFGASAWGFHRAA